MKTGLRVSLVFASVSLALIVAFAAYGKRKDTSEGKGSGAETQWEYLIVSGGSANLSTAGNENYSSMRKQPDGSFSREYFPLERNFDKLGVKGWELVSVFGTQNDPVYFFKRLKEGR